MVVVGDRRAAAPASAAEDRRACRPRSRAWWVARGNTSGEQFLAFSTANRLPVGDLTYRADAVVDGSGEGGDALGELFRATVEATEESVVNALLAAHTVVGRDGNTYHALPVDRTLAALRAAGRLGSYASIGDGDVPEWPKGAAC